MSKLTEYKVIMALQDPNSEIKEVTLAINTIHLEEHEVLDDKTKEMAIDLIMENDPALNREHLKSTTFKLVE